MPHEPVRQWDARWAFSHKEQTDYATALLAADLTRSLPLFAPDVADLSVLRIGGARPFSGDAFARGSHNKLILQDLRLARQFDAGSISLPYLIAFCMGAVTTTEPDIGVRWSHAISFRDPATSVEARVTTLYEELNSGFKRVIRSCAVDEVTLNGNKRDRVQLAGNIIAAGEEDTATAVTLPALTAEQLFSGQDVKFEYGDKGGALTDIGERVRSWAIRIGQSLDADGGYTIGSGKFRSRIWTGRQLASLEWVMEIDRSNRDIVDDLVNDTQKEVKITLDSKVALGAGFYQAVFRFPDLRLTATPIGFDGDFAIYNISVSEDQVYKDDAVADSPLTVTVDNDIAAYFTAA